MSGRSRGASSRTYVRSAYPHRVSIPADLIRNLPFSLCSGYRTVHPTTEKLMIDGEEHLVYRFSDEAEARKFADWTIGTFIEREEG